VGFKLGTSVDGRSVGSTVGVGVGMSDGNGDHEGVYDGTSVGLAVAGTGTGEPAATAGTMLMTMASVPPSEDSVAEPALLELPAALRLLLLLLLLLALLRELLLLLARSIVSAADGTAAFLALALDAGDRTALDELEAACFSAMPVWKFPLELLCALMPLRVFTREDEDEDDDEEEA
jgi:hypothetical protein